MSTNLTLLLLPIKALVVEEAPGWAKVEFTPQEVQNAVEAGANLFKNNQTVKVDKGYGEYPHPFHNDLRWRKYGLPGPPIDFPNQGALLGGLLEFPLLRSPRGEIFGVTTDLAVNPDRVVFRMDNEETVTFMGVMSHAGNKNRGFLKREFLVSDVYY